MRDRARKVASRAYDVAVVGGGAAGCVVASRLAGSGGRSVVLLEAGPDRRRSTPPDWRDGWRLPVIPDWGFESEPDGKGATSRLRRGRLLGGTSWLTRFAVRGAAADFDAWAERGNPGWRFTDVLPAFRRLETDLDAGGEPWHGRDGPIPVTRYPEHQPADIHAAAIDGLGAMGYPTVADHNAPEAVGVGRMPMNSRDGERVTAVDAYLPADLPVPGLTIRTDAPVARIVLEAGRATGVILIDGTEVRADWVVLAAGTYGSPAVLMRSGIGPAEHLRSVGIDVRVDLPGVGANLADHPAVSLDSGWHGPATGGPILHSIATFRSAGAMPDGAPDLMLWFADPVEDDPDFWIEAVLLKPRSRGSVRLRSPDPAATPRITLPGARDPADVDRLAEAYRRGSELIARPEIRARTDGGAQPPPTTSDEIRRLVVEDAYSIPHVVGTCAMGPSSDEGGVVDHLGRVHGVERLSVIDASIIPEAPSGFPHIITLMLAEHLSERLPALL